MAGLEDSWVRVRQGFRPNEVAEAASYCGLFGVVAGGAREWQKTATLVTEEQILQEEEKIRRRYPDRSFGTPKLKRMLRYHASKEAHGLRMLRVCTSSTKSCLAFGLISATYVTAEQASQALRGQDDALNSVFAASVLGAAIGTRWLGPRGAVVGTVACGLVSLPFGYARVLARGDVEEPEAEALPRPGPCPA